MHWITKALIFAGFVYMTPSLLRLPGELGLYIKRIDHSPGPCRIIPGIECGSEDIAVSSDGLAFISSGLKSFSACDPSKIKSSIFLFDFKNPRANVTKLHIRSDVIREDLFDPQGVTIYENSSGLWLFVVDHSESEDVVRIFRVRRDDLSTLFHFDDIRNKNFRCLNDIIAVGQRSFYVTSSARFCRIPIVGSIETFLLPNMGSVVFFDGMEGHTVAASIGVANGINLSPSGDYLYVAATTEHRIYVYKRNQENNSIKLKTDVVVESHPDNINVNMETGELYIGAHPYILHIFIGRHNELWVPPAQVIRVRALKDDWSSYEVNEILFNSGQKFIRGSSVAAFYKDQLLIGTVFHRLAYCRVARIDEV